MGSLYTGMLVFILLLVIATVCSCIKTAGMYDEIQDEDEGIWTEEETGENEDGD